MASDRDRKPRRAPPWGAFYWVPTPTTDGVVWDLVLNQDAGLEPDAGHTRLWPTVLAALAALWGKDARVLQLRLRDRYTGLPRGRVCRRGTSYLILHGEDAPIPDWRQVLFDRFQLAGHRTVFRFDEHERMIAGDPEALQAILGFDLELRGILADEDDS